MDAAGEIWAGLLAVTPPPPPWLVAGAAAGAALLVVSPVTWPRLRHVVTTAHEGGHAVAAAMTGRRLRGIRLHSDSSGLALSSGPARGPGMVMTLLAGYPGPALLGLAAAAVLGTGRPVAVLWGLLLLLALLLLQIRNLFGLWSVAVTAGALLVVSLWTPAPVQAGCAYAVTWFLLLAAPRPVLELARRRRGAAGTSDADQLARVTGVPAVVWVAVLAASTLAASAAGAVLLLR